MNPFHSMLVLVVVFLAVFWEAAFSGIRHLLGAQVDLLPALVVYASLRSGPVTMTLAAVGGGLLFDSLSANPPGVTLLPLFIPGFILYSKRDLVLRDQVFAQFVLGTAASAFVPLMTVLLLLTLGHPPLLGLGSVWQWLVMAIGGGAATPLLFQIVDSINAALNYRYATESSFRPDREIRRGRK